ncbi:MAG TPA: MFS transporter, partial [Anaerolineales bacterium]|nr:MFS transporter [Anaerolineales bacterium]
MAEAQRQSWQRTLYIVFFAQLMTAVGFSSIFPFLPLYVESLGTSTSLSLELLAGLVFSAQAFTMMLASPIWGALADRYGRKVMVERAAFGGAVLLLMMAYVRSAEQLVALRAIQGFVTGTLAASNALVAASVPRERTGYAMGLLQTALGTGVAVGPLIGGAAADAFGYRAAFYLTAALLFLAGLLV